MNTLGTHFKVTSFGESHGSYVGCLLEGCPSGLSVDMTLVQQEVSKRKTGLHDFASARQEDDLVEIVSGIFEEKTLGTPICILIKNKDARPQDYEALKDVFRPGHADLSYHRKYDHRDFRGGGRSSIRITAPMVAAGEIARQLLSYYFLFENNTWVNSIGTVSMDEAADLEYTEEKIENSVLRCPDENTTKEMLELIQKTKAEGDTLGGSIHCKIKNLPAGIGEPIFGKMQAQLAHAMLSINTVMAFEFGDGREASTLTGSQHNDQFILSGNEITTSTNRQGGISGGISTGAEVYFRIYFKPLSGIQQTQQTLNTEKETVELNIGGRHDVCAVPRAVPIVKAYTQIVLADLFLLNKLTNL